jgi:hypothetical protein
VLARHSVPLDDLLPNVREFLRNPRICRVALALLDRMSLRPDELTVERLLMEYWQARLRERGDLLAHNAEDFSKLLRLHAKAWREQPKRRFDRDDWRDYSGAARRLDPASVQNDLTEIEEGRFLSIAPDDSGAYEFRSEALPYALALLINAELKDELRQGNRDLKGQLDKMIDAIRGFDLLADIVAAAVGLACLDDTYPAVGRHALIGIWLSLQNVPETSLEAVAAYVSVRPEGFLDAAESPGDWLNGSVGYDTLAGLLMFRRDRPAVRNALVSRVPKWLGRWSQMRDDANYYRNPNQQAERKARIDIELRALSIPEAERFRRLTVDTGAVETMQLDHLAARLIAGRSLRPFAEGLYGWALTQAVAWRPKNAFDALAWVVRINLVDWAETRKAVEALVADTDENSSSPMKVAAATVLRLLGDKCSSDRADYLSPLGKVERWKLVETFCETNPHDPEAPPGTRLGNARDAAGAIAPLAVWRTMTSTAEDHELKVITPALARFDPAVVVGLLRQILTTAPDRTGTDLKGLTCYIVE